MTTHDLLIRGGTVVDGSGAEPYSADVAVTGGRITAVGQVDGPAHRTVEADGALVTPGFVDVHCHYDGQATWDSQLVPSAWHGVTTAVMGNCGVGFAPVHPADHQKLIELMEGVEDIPGAALHEGLAWDWESFPEYLDAVDRRPHDIDIGAQVPHGALRLYVMGERGASREDATKEDIDTMGRLARQGIEAGALGFTTSRTRNHRTSTGDWTPTLTAAADELAGIATLMAESGAGVLQVVSDFANFDEEMANVLGMAEASGRPLSVSVTQTYQRPEAWRRLLETIADANAHGMAVTAQVAARPVGVLLGLQATIDPTRASATARELTGRPLPERVARLRQPEFRQVVLAEMAEAASVFPWDRVYPLGDPPDYEPDPSGSVAAEAARAGTTPETVAYDHLLADGGRGFLYVPFLNYADGNLDAVRSMLEDEHSVVGLGDGGAHVGTICDGSFPTTMLTHWVRDRSRGERMDLALVVAKQTSRTATMIGLHDRGLVAEGMKADLNVIDLDGLTLHRPTMAFDLPAGGKRLLQRADGYLHTFVSGEEVYAQGEHTGALPGRLVRGGQPAPASR
jgi:N-acyl-D-aspartate/D-glutamate deacylase